MPPPKLITSRPAGGGAAPFTGVRIGTPVRNGGAAGSQAPNRILPFHANPTFRAASLNAFSVWQQITAGEASDRVLFALAYSWTPISPGTLFVQIGTGAAGAEVPIFEHGIDNNESGSGSTPFTTQYAPIPFIKVLANTRIAVRTYFHGAAGASVPFVGVYLDTIDATQNTQGWQAWVDTYVTGGEVTSVAHVPAIAGFVSVAAPGAAYTQLIAAAAQKLLVLGFAHDVTDDSISAHAQLAVATGAVGAEVDHAEIPLPGSTSSFRCFGSSYCRPVLVNAGERVAVRLNSSSTGAAIDGSFWVANAN